MIDDLLADLKDDEGFVPHAYQDTLGFWTLGFGFLIDRNRGGAIPLPIAEQWLLYAATQRWNDLVRKAPWLLDQPEEVQRAIGNMAYQLGPFGVLGFRKMLEALQAGEYERAADEGLDSTWAKQTPNRAERVTARIRACAGTR